MDRNDQEPLLVVLDEEWRDGTSPKTAACTLPEETPKILKAKSSDIQGFFMTP